MTYLRFFLFCRLNRLIEPFTNIFQLQRNSYLFLEKSFFCKLQFFFSKFLMKSETLPSYAKTRKQCPEVTSALSEKYLPLNFVLQGPKLYFSINVEFEHPILNSLKYEISNFSRKHNLGMH